MNISSESGLKPDMTSGRRRENVGKASGMILDICTLRDDGVSYGDYLEQLTYLLFLKMADEYGKIYKRDVGIPDEYNWDSLKTKKGADLEAHCMHD